MNLRAYLILYLLGTVACGSPQKQEEHQLSAVKRLELECENENTTSCLRLGRHFNQHDRVSNRRSKRAFRRGCELGHGRSCMALAELWESDQKQVPMEGMGQSRRIESLYQQACELGEQRGCVEMNVHRFMHAQKLSRQFEALGGLKRSCDKSGNIGCIEYLRAQLALGETPSSLTLSRLAVQCRLRASVVKAGDVCERLEYLRCRDEEQASRCLGAEQRESIIDQLSCPADDLDWLVSVIHTGIQECRQPMPSQLILQFRSSGSIELSASQNQLSECFRVRLEKMSILPIRREDGCTLKMRF